MVTRWVGQLCADAGGRARDAGGRRPPAPNSHLPNLLHRISSLNVSFRDRVIWPALRRSAFAGFCCHHFVETSTKILEHHDSGISTGTAGNRAARVGGRAGLVQARDRHAVLRPARAPDAAPPPAPHSARRRGRSHASCADCAAPDRAGFRPRGPGSCRRSGWARTGAASSGWRRATSSLMLSQCCGPSFSS